MSVNSRSRSSLAGTATLVRIGLRRDRTRIAAWTVTLAVLVVAIAASWDRLYPTEQSRRELAATLALSPSLTAILGPLFNPRSTGGLTAWRSVAGYVLVLALVECFVVVRHSRANEQDGVAELVCSGVVGAAAQATSAFLVATAYGLGFGLLTVAGLVASGLAIGGSLALAAAISGACAIFAGIAVITSQLAHSSRGANGLSGALIAAFFAISAVGNASANSPLVWMSPFGWAEQVRAFGDERWWLIGLMWGFAICGSMIGTAISARRDLGASLLPARLGRPTARSYLAHPTALAWRLDRGWLMWWLFGALLLGALEGSILNTSLQAMASNPALVTIIENLGGSTNLASAFIVLMVGIFALGACGFGIATLLRLRQDELAGRAELTLSTPTSRSSWARGHVLMSYLGAALVVMAGGTGIGLVYGAAVGQVATIVGHAVGAALITVPAVWSVLGICALALGFTPQWSFIGWIALAWCVIAGWFGVILGLPDAILKTSPFGHLPGWPGAPMSWTPEVVLLLFSAGCVLSARFGLRRRDVPS